MQIENEEKRRYGAQPISQKLFQGLGDFPNKSAHVGTAVPSLLQMVSS